MNNDCSISFHVATRNIPDRKEHYFQSRSHFDQGRMAKVVRVASEAERGLAMLARQTAAQRVPSRWVGVPWCHGAMVSLPRGLLMPPSPPPEQTVKEVLASLLRASSPTTSPEVAGLPPTSQVGWRARCPPPFRRSCPPAGCWTASPQPPSPSAPTPPSGTGADTWTPARSCCSLQGDTLD